MFNHPVVFEFYPYTLIYTLQQFYWEWKHKRKITHCTVGYLRGLERWANLCEYRYYVTVLYFRLVLESLVNNLIANLFELQRIFFYVKLNLFVRSTESGQFFSLYFLALVTFINHDVYSSLVRFLCKSVFVAAMMADIIIGGLAFITLYYTTLLLRRH